MKVHIDEERCEGHGRCYALAPRCSSPTTSATGRPSATAPWPPGEEDRARLAVANCPELAITIEEEG